MKNIFPVNFICLFAVSASLLLTACNKGGETPPVHHNAFLVNNEITVSNVRNIPEGLSFDKLKLEICGFDWDVIDEVEAVYENGKAVLNLPASFPPEKLMKAVRSDFEDYEGFWPAEKTTDASAKVAGFKDNNIIAYSGNKVVGRVFLTDWEGTGAAEYKYFVYYHYSDKSFTLSGYNLTKEGNRKSYRYEASFETGWNSYANIKAKETDNPPYDTNPVNDKYKDTCTNIIPGDTKLYWRFEEYL